MYDPIVNEIRKIREANAARLNYDLDAILHDWKRTEKELGLPVVTLAPNRIEKPVAERSPRKRPGDRAA